MNQPTVSVVLSTAEARHWPALERAVESVRRQTSPPRELIVVVDHDDLLLRQAADRFADPGGLTPAGPVGEGLGGPPVFVVANTATSGRAGSRNTGVAWATGDVVAFLDDRCRVPSVTWIETLASLFTEPDIAAVGGAVRADWGPDGRPRWFPDALSRVVGATEPVVAPMPDVAALARQNVSVRRDVFDLVGGFSDGFHGVGDRAVHCEVIELCRRIHRRLPGARLALDPRLDVVQLVDTPLHDFPAFTDRCRQLGVRDALIERNFPPDSRVSTAWTRTTVTVRRGVTRGLTDALLGRPSGLRQAGAALAGAGWMVVGYANGRFGDLRQRNPIRRLRRGTVAAGRYRPGAAGVLNRKEAA